MAGKGLSSRERLLAAINCEESDHVPCVLSFIGPWVAEYWKGKDRLQEMLRLGLDQYVSIAAPRSYRRHKSLCSRRRLCIVNGGFDLSEGELGEKLVHYD